MNNNKKPNFEGIKSELTAIGADFEKEKGTIYIIFPDGTTKAAIPPERKRKYLTVEQWSDMHYFQKGIAIVFPARNNYTIKGVFDRRVILSPK